jgi:MFS family permease
MRLSYYTRKTRDWISNLPIGGVWGRSLQVQAQKNLRWFWFDGLFASAGDNIILNYISLYILALGGTEVQVGLMSSLSSFSGALMLFLGAILAERIGRHKEITVLTGGIFGRIAVLFLVFVPILFHGANIVWIAIAFSVLRDMCNNLAYPSWMSVVNQTVPLEGRGRYFGARNFVMNISSIIATLLAGKLITLFVGEIGFQVAIGLAFVLGVGSVFSFSHIKTVATIPQSQQRSKSSLKDAFSLLKGHPEFIALMLVAGLWNFSINVVGPFFNVYMAKNLHFSASTVGLMAVVTSLTGFLAFNRIGSLSDRLGPRKLQIVSMFLIPTLPLMWLFVKTPLHVALINAFGGVIWAAFNLASFNFMLNSIPKDQVPRYSALYQIMVTLSLALGALLGSALITRWGFVSLLLLSTILRLISALVFSRWVHEPEKVKAISE